ncbi:hypothetical protein BANRA_05568 [Klebsiella pneumoniae]|nr:hypothetical protein BANRA_05568 [Klebsiella pneumoniae]
MGLKLHIHCLIRKPKSLKVVNTQRLVMMVLSLKVWGCL